MLRSKWFFKPYLCHVYNELDRTWRVGSILPGRASPLSWRRSSDLATKADSNSTSYLRTDIDGTRHCQCLWCHFCHSSCRWRRTKGGYSQVWNCVKNKTGYTAIQSRTVGQEQHCENRLEFRNVTDGRTDTVRCRVACPRLKTLKSLSLELRCSLCGRRQKIWSLLKKRRNTNWLSTDILQEWRLSQDQDHPSGRRRKNSNSIHVI